MNERIDQLLVKAGAYFGGDGVVYDTFDPKKFAELIVEECTTVIEQNLFQGIGWNTSRAVRRHFGIEDEE
jgi:hypothetical protein